MKMDNEANETTEVSELAKVRARLTHSLPAKVAAFILLVIFACITAASVLGACAMVDLNFYTKTSEILKKEAMENLVYQEADRIYYIIKNEGAIDFDKVYGGINFSCEIFDKNGHILFDNHDNKRDAYCIKVPVHDEYGETDINFFAYIDKGFPAADKYSAVNAIISLAYALRYWIYVIAALSLIVCIVLFIFLMSASGHKTGHIEIVSGPLGKIPLDLFTAVIGLLVYAIGHLCANFSYMYSDNIVIAFYCFAAVAVFILTVGWFMSLATRVKLGRWWKNTIVYVVLRWLWLLLKAAGRGIACLFRNLPLIWKTVLFMLALGLASLFGIAFHDFARRAALWLIGMIILFVIVAYTAIVLRKLQIAGRKIARGDLSCRVDTRRMLWDFKEHGENLNSIGLGMTRAVDERMKSERLKTELITNVSHDIKTPLTSIINYVDLISKEECKNEKISEYIEVLSRQSERLKKLIEDLVEASKASTGNVEVALSPCDVSVLLSQTAGEYESRLCGGSLELIVTKPETPIMIMADGRLLWRVFDNLMNNIAKYSQPDTRVYLSLEHHNGMAMISFKNISKYPLNITADELMERFVRGDSSRHTDGSGLGLSIAKSLTELQQGSLELTIDGDFFKVSLKFKTI